MTIFAVRVDQPISAFCDTEQLRPAANEPLRYSQQIMFETHAPVITEAVGVKYRKLASRHVPYASAQLHLAASAS